MTAQKCSEKACPYFAEPGHDLCRYHIDMFEFDESLTDSGLDYEALHSSEEDGTSGPVAQLSVTNWRDAWLEKKERRQDKEFIEKFRIAARYSRLKLARICPQCGHSHDGVTTLCLSCLCDMRKAQRELRRARRDQGLCEKCGGVREDLALWCRKCRKRHYARSCARRDARIRKHLCVFCGNSEDAKGRLCSDCRGEFSKHHRDRNRVIVESRRQANLCIQCGSPVSHAGKPRCVECTMKLKERNRRASEKQRRLRPKRVAAPKNPRGRYLSSISNHASEKRLRAAGICVGCRGPSDCASYLCTRCKTAHNARYEAEAQAWLKKGICARCHKNPVVESRRCCLPCLLARRKSNEKRRRKPRQPDDNKPKIPLPNAADWRKEDANARKGEEWQNRETASAAPIRSDLG